VGKELKGVRLKKGGTGYEKGDEKEPGL